jgi:hexokinase
MSNVWRSIVASVNRVHMLPSLADMLLPSFSPFLPQTNGTSRTIDSFLSEVKCLLTAPLDPSILLAISTKLQEQFKEKLQTSASCMLPSYNHTLPTGYEKGKYLALDVGGSTFRIALVSLTGKDNGSSMKIVKMSIYRITNKVRALQGHNFFDWMAERIGETLNDPIVKEPQGESPLPMGLSWSFPVEYARPSICRLRYMLTGIDKPR